MVEAKEYYNAWVGTKGIGQSITVKEDADTLELSTSISHRIIMAVLGFGFFAVLILSLTQQLPVYVYAVNGFLALLSLFVFFKVTFLNKTLVLNKKWRHVLFKSGSATKRILKYDSIKDINLISFALGSDSPYTETYKNWYMVIQSRK